MKARFIFLAAVLVLLSLIHGCATTPSFSQKSLSSISPQIQPLPIKAIVLLPTEFQRATCKAGSRKLGVHRIKVGKSSVKLFKEVFPRMFTQVDFVTQRPILRHYDILIIPELHSTYIEPSFSDADFTVEYELSFFDQTHQLIFHTSARGSVRKGLGGTFLKGLLTLGLGGPTITSMDYCNSFAKAEVQAMSKLVDNIISSPKLLAYADGVKGSFVKYEGDNEIQELAKPEFPARLVCKVQFTEPSGNHILDAQEEGKLLVTIENKGKGDAHLTQIELNNTERIEGLSYKKRVFIGTIPTGNIIHKEIPLRADKEIPTSQVKFKVQATEVNGFKAEPAFVIFNTREIQPPGISEEQLPSSIYSAVSSPPVELKSPDTAMISPPQIDTSQRWAVVIGISSYKDTRISSLRYASADAKAFYEWLISPTGGKYAPSNVNCLLDKNATAKNIKNALFVWLKQAIQEDIVTIFFACHGSPESPDSLNNLFLLPYDAQYDEIATSGFPMWDLETALKRFIKAKKVVIIADACHSGGIGQSFDIARRANRGIKVNPIGSELQSLSKVGDGVCVISASDNKQFSQESKDWGGGHGVFTYFLLKGLKGEADYSKDNRVTLGELIPYLSEQVRRATKSAQCPTVAGKFDPALSIGR